MELNQYAMIVALARLSGVTGTKSEIFEKFMETYKEVYNEPANTDGTKSEVFQRPF